MNDAEAIKLAIQGREEGFRAIFSNHSDFLFTHALRFLRCQHRAEDAVQETFSAAFRSISSFKGQAKLRTWLYKILFNSLIKIGKSERDLLIDTEPPAAKAVSEDKTINRLMVKDVLQQLDEKDQNILLLAYWDELPVKEIAEILELSITNTKVSLFRARKRFSRIWPEKTAKELEL